LIEESGKLCEYHPELAREKRNRLFGCPVRLTLRRACSKAIF
jgi:hypothetical protein